MRNAFDAASGQSNFKGCLVPAGSSAPYRVILQTGQTYAFNTPSPLVDGFYGKQLFVATRGTKVTGIPPGQFLTEVIPDVEIIGNGATIERAEGAPKFRLLFMTHGKVTLRDLTLRGGDVRGATEFDHGGAILVQRGVLSLDRVTLDKNTADLGGAIYAHYLATVNVLGSTFTRNSGAGAITSSAEAPVNVANSTFSDNSFDIFAMHDFNTDVTLSHNTFQGELAWVGTGVLIARGNIFGKRCQFDGTGALTTGDNVGHSSCPVVHGDLGSLQAYADNGGPTDTRGFIVPSLLQDVDPTCTFASRGTNPLFTDGAAITTDQRGVPRAPGTCDVGSYEEGSVKLSGTIPGAPQGLPYAAVLAGTGGTGPYSFELVSGLPWLTLEQLGNTYTLKGTPPAGHGSTFPIVLRTADANSLAGYGTYSISIANGVPYAPTLTGSSFNPANGTMTVTFTPPTDDGGGAINGYKVKCASSGFQSAASLTSPLVFPVPAGPTHTGCALYATNGIGESPASSATFTMASAIAVVTSLTRASPEISPPDTRIDFNVTFNRPVTNLSGADFELVTTGNITGAVNTGVVGSGTNYTVVVYTGTSGSGTLKLNFIDRDLVFDSSSTPVGGAGLGNGNFAGPTYRIALAPGAPTVSAIQAFNSFVELSINPPGSDGGLPITGYQATCNPGAHISPVSLSPVVRVPVINGQGYACTAVAINGAGAGAASAASNVDVDPVFVSRIRRLNPSPTTKHLVYFEVTFTRPVTGVDYTDFVVTTTGLFDATVVGVSGTGTTYQVCVYTGRGSGTLRLDLVDNDTIRDATAPLYGTGTGTVIDSGDVYRVNATKDDFYGFRSGDLLWQHTDGRVAMWAMKGSIMVTGGNIFPGGTAWTVTHAADLDGDGKSDLVWQNANGAITLYTMNGRAAVIKAKIINPGDGWTVTHVADLNGDGKNDLIFQHADGTIAAWLMNGVTMTSGASLLGPGGGWTVTKTGDFNGDGKADLLFTHTDGRVAIWYMNGLTPILTTQILDAGTGWSVKHVVDLNGDNFSDIVWQHADGRVAVWTINAFGNFNGQDLLGAGTGWTVTHTGDFNGDGKADLLFSHTDGRVAIYLMNGLTPSVTAEILNAGTGWSVKRVSDLDGDGSSGDLVWEHLDGRVAVWRMVGTNMLDGAEILGPGTGWKILDAK
ncbi:hypothetical protein BWI17_15000 [Betaproteobacteria bacterium GR16-43]|nr:hypothetical protein BWI17_15000 [Betaproteobacteria bacterium GR16-43]